MPLVALLIVGVAVGFLATRILKVNMDTPSTIALGVLGALIGTLVLRGGPADGISAEVRRGGPLTLGEEALVPSSAEQRRLLDVVGDLVSAPERDSAGRLVELGVAFVHVPDPVDPDLAPEERVRGTGRAWHAVRLWIK